MEASPDGVLGAYRVAGKASAAAAATDSAAIDRTAAAFFDVDNTLIRGSSLFHLAVGLAKHQFFTPLQVVQFGSKQMKFILSGSEDLEDMASATEAALSFVEGRSVDELAHLAEQIFDEILTDKLIPGTLAIAQAHLDAGQRVWLVTATPIEIATIIAKRLGLTGALGTVAEIKDGIYTGRLVGSPLHGVAKAEAVRAIATREGLDLSLCAAYSDSSNDVPMLSLVGDPVAVNPDSSLRQYAQEKGWKIRDFRRRTQIKRMAVPVSIAMAGVAVGVAAGYVSGRASRR